MPSLFTLPKVVPLSSAGALLPGAKLYFFQTGTSTPQNTYQDINLSTAHANPVVADAEGVFAPIYLDPTLPDYRVRLTTSADVQLWQLDDIPAAFDSAPNYVLESSAPYLQLTETDASSNNKKWRLSVNGETLTLSILNDAESVETVVFEIDRTGTTLDSLNFPDADKLQIGGLPVPDSDSDSYTGTLTGLDSTVTTTVTLRRSGNLCIVAWAAASGTSNTNALTVTGMPATFCPSAARQGNYCTVTDNGTQQQGRVAVESSGDLTFSVGAASGTFTSSGGKGFPAGMAVYFLS